ncbi:MAG: hypothetical protein ACKVOE_08470 [Rickettsiales bacterium]
MSDEKNGIGVSGVVGGIGGGLAAGAITNNIISQRGNVKAFMAATPAEGGPFCGEPIAKSWANITAKANEANASDKAKNLAQEMASKSAARNEILNVNGHIASGNAVNHLHFSPAVNGVHDITVTHVDGKTHTIIGALKKLPEGFEPGTAYHGGAAAAFFEGEKPFLKVVEADVAKDLAQITRKGGGFAFGLRNASAGGKAAIIGMALAGTAAGAYTVHAILGGKHSNAVAAEPEQTMAKA